jgi:hypothetical protein
MGKLAGTVGYLEKQNDINVMWFSAGFEPATNRLKAKFARNASMSEKLS